MIISKKYGFIFLKPLQVGGSAIEIALQPHLGRNDILTPQTPYNKQRDSAQYNHKGKNYWKWFVNPYFNHINAQELRLVDKPTYEHYPKVTIVRDPIDTAISLFEWEKKQIEKRLSPQQWEIGIYNSIKWLAQQSKFKFQHSKLQRQLYIDIDKSRTELEEVITTNNFFEFAEQIPSRWKQYTYLYVDGEKVCKDENYLHYENLEEEFIEFTKRHNIPYNTSKKLIHTKEQSLSQNNFFVEALKNYVQHNPQTIVQGGGPLPREQIVDVLSRKIRRATGIIINDSPRIVEDFNYKKFSEEKIETIVRNYLNQFPI